MGTVRFRGRRGMPRRLQLALFVLAAAAVYLISAFVIELLNR